MAEAVRITFVPEQFTASEGRTVAYQIAEGVYRPAVIVRCWGNPDDTLVAVNLVVTFDGSNDDMHQVAGRQPGALQAWVTSRQQGPNVGQWLPRAPRA